MLENKTRHKIRISEDLVNSKKFTENDLDENQNELSKFSGKKLSISSKK